MSARARIVAARGMGLPGARGVALAQSDEVPVIGPSRADTVVE